MTTASCPACGRENDAAAATCEACGLRLQAPTTAEMFAAAAPAIKPAPSPVEAPAITDPSEEYTAPVINPRIPLMYQNIRSWSIWTLVIGAASIFSGSFLDPVWGIMLLVTAAISWFSRLPTIFAMYAVVIGWAAFNNAISQIGGGNLGWLIFAALQVLWFFQLLGDLRRNRILPVEEEYQKGNWPVALKPPADEQRLTARFALASTILGVLSLIAFPAACGGTIAWSIATRPDTLPRYIGYLLTGINDVAILALGLGLTALLSRKNTKKGLAIAGVATSAIQLIGFIAFEVFGLLV
jgi:hypothetical protein